MLAAKLLSSCGSEEKLYVDDVFSTYLYTGNGSTQTINNGIDLAGKGGMVWCKSRGTASHLLFDTERGVGQRLYSDLTAGQEYNASVLTSFNSDGFSLGNLSSINGSGTNYASWTFRKAQKFFDVVTWTGDGSGSRSISHSLGTAPGMVVVKCTSAASNWMVWHHSISGQNNLYLNTTDGTSTVAADPISVPGFPSSLSTTLFDVSTGTDSCNTNGATYVAYLFAHDTTTDGIIQCGSFTTDGSGNATVNLGWEPQFLQAKASSTNGAWFMFDQMRGWGMSSDENLLANSANAAITGSEYGNPTATGFYVTNYASSATYVYLAIRRPNKPPTTGTEVYNAIARTTTGGVSTITGVGFPPDLLLGRQRVNPRDMNFYDRLRGYAKRLISSSTAAEESVTSTTEGTLVQDGYIVDGLNGYMNGGTNSEIDYQFRRAPGVFDVVCYTGTGVAHTEAHNLGVVPELMIVKRRNTSFSWYVYHKDMAASDALILNDTLAKLTGNNAWGNTHPTASVLTVSNNGDNSTNASGSTYVTYLFATKAGISKVGSYTGNGSSQTIDCGFTTGARFVMIKCADQTSDWRVFDSVRGIVAGNDPYLALNTTASEVTSQDVIDPDSTGFSLNTLFNDNGVKFIYLAFS